MTAARRKRLRKGSFALPSQRKYPIDTKKRARAALSYAARKDTAGSYSTVRAAVLKKYPSLRKRKRSK
jgi:hypothetical protein